MSIYTNVLQRIKKSKNFHENVQLAQYLGESKQSISNWTGGGKFNLDKVLDVCAKDGLDIDYILTGKESPSKIIDVKESKEYLILQAKYEQIKEDYHALTGKSVGNQPAERAAENPPVKKEAG